MANNKNQDLLDSDFLEEEKNLIFETKFNMTIFEKIIWFFMTIGVFFIYMKIPGPIFSMSCLLLSFYYLFFGIIIFNQSKFKNGFKKSYYKGLSPLRLIGTIILGISVFSIIFFVILFSYLDIPSPKLSFLLCFSFIVIIFGLFAKNKGKHFNKVLIRISIFLFLGWGAYFLKPNRYRTIYIEEELTSEIQIEKDNS